MILSPARNAWARGHCMHPARLGLVNGTLGMLIFSASLPATRVAVLEFDPLFLTLARASIAALCAGLWLAWARARVPPPGDLARLVVVALGVVVGFPLLTAIALQHVTAVRGMVFIGLLPLTTALFGVLRGGERPRPAYWLFSALGAALVGGFAILSGGGEGALAGDLLMLAAVLVCGLGYAEGAVLSRRLGGVQVISWALIVALPVMLPLAVILRPDSVAGIAAAGWIGLGYVSLFSMFVGFVFWYRGLALGGIALVSQVQLLQPFCGMALAAAVLGETLDWPVLVVAAGVAGCVAAARRFARR
jgi:drug/metabolite transporter (DMT)-like permease